MARWRSHISPPQPRSWEHYVELLQIEKWRRRFTTYNNGQLTVTYIRAVDGSIAVVFADVEYLRSVRAVCLYIDATFKICPRKPRILQFFTIMAEVDGCVRYDYLCTYNIYPMFVSIFI